MSCSECERLKRERNRRARAFALSVTLMNALAVTTDNADRKINLRAKTQEAKVDLEVAEAALAGHQVSHSVAKGSGGKISGAT